MQLEVPQENSELVISILRSIYDPQVIDDKDVILLLKVIHKMWTFSLKI